MTKHEWSEEQPPEWQPNTPPPAAPPVQPEATGSETSEAKGFGGVVSASWNFVVDHARYAFSWASGAFLLTVGASLAMIFVASSFFVYDQDFVTALNTGGVGTTEDNEIDLSASLNIAFFILLVSLAAGVVQFWFTAILTNRYLNSVSSGAKGWFRLLYTNLIFAGLVIGAIAIPFLAVVTNSNAAVNSFGVFALLAVVGLLFFVALGLIPLTGVVLAEGLSGVPALKRSLELSRGYRFRMLLPLLVVTLLASIATSAITQFGVLFDSSVTTALVAFAVSNAASIVIGTIFSTAVAIAIYQNQLNLPRK
jgi:MFS family permease